MPNSLKTFLLVLTVAVSALLTTSCVSSGYAVVGPHPPPVVVGPPPAVIVRPRPYYRPRYYRPMPPPRPYYGSHYHAPRGRRVIVVR